MNGREMFRQTTNEKQTPQHKLAIRTKRCSKVQADARCPSSKRQITQQWQQQWQQGWLKIGPQCVLVWDFIQAWYGLNKWDKLFCFVVIQSLLRSSVLQLYDLRCKLREGESKNLSFQRTREKLTWKVVKCNNWHFKNKWFCNKSR